MTPAERHARATALFAEAIEHPEGEREAWLAAADADAEVHEAAARMLRYHESGTGALLDRPLLARTAVPDDGSDTADSLLGQRIGVWRLTGLLGQGGMGTVYRAERDDASFAQHAALKLVRPGTDPGFRARFLRERALLAGLDHPGVARLLDGGVAPDGTPFLAMERVDGEPITAFAETHALSVPDRLRLFLQACDAVAYAHHSLVVHRDLKPDHIVVEDRPAGPRVRLLDFGIATLLETDDAMRTRTAGGPMTPQYAAPEQFLARPVTTATDVYALGVILYELLAGRRPYEVRTLTAAQTEHVVCETMPSRPSSVTRAEGRARALQGDLDTIVMKALSKEPRRRYAGADALADDLRRHLDGLPVRARPATVHYRAGRFVRRNRVAVVATLAVGLALMAGTGVALRQARMARAEADKATAVSDFLQSTLLSASPGIGEAVRPSDLRVVDVLRPAAEQAQAAFPGRPDVRAAVLYTVGRTYLDLGLWDEAEEATLTALAIRDSLYGETPHEERIQSYDVAARVAQMRNDSSAVGWSRRALALRTARYGPDSPEVGEGLEPYGEILAWFGHHEAALRVLRRALDVAQRTRGERSAEANRALHALALLFLQTDRSAEADAVLGTLITRAREGGPDDDPDLALFIHYRSVAALFQRDVARAERLNAEALRLQEARFDGDHPVLNEARGIHAALLIERGRFAEAETIMRAAVEAFEASLDGTDRFELHLARAELGAALAGLGRTDEAERLLRPGTDRLRAKFGDRYGWTRHTAAHLADLYEAAGRPSEAQPYRALAEAPPSGP